MKVKRRRAAEEARTEVERQLMTTRLVAALDVGGGTGALSVRDLLCPCAVVQRRTRGAQQQVHPAQQDGKPPEEKQIKNDNNLAGRSFFSNFFFSVLIRRKETALA